MGPQRRTAMVAGWQQDSVFQQSQRPQLHRDVRREDADAELSRAKRRSRLEPDLVGRRKARRVLAAPGAAVRTAGDARTRIRPAGGDWAWRRWRRRQRRRGKRPWSCSRGRAGRTGASASPAGWWTRRPRRTRWRRWRGPTERAARERARLLSRGAPERIDADLDGRRR